jgi:iron complex transport system substrate-binding protein
MRIVSLLPAATEWICAFGARADLVGRSHACDYPPSIRDRPVVTRAQGLDASDSAAIDAQVKGRLRQGLSLYVVDLELLRELEPDLVVTQAQCAVCAVSLSGLEAALAGWTGAHPQLFSLAPMTLKQVFDAALRLGRTIGRMAESMAVLADAERRLRRLHERLGLGKQTGPAPLPTVACIEWLAPLMTAGHWMPDVAGHAGLRAVLATPGARSNYVDWAEVQAADPDVLAVMPCGFTLSQTRRDLHHLTAHAGWGDLRAVRAGRVYLFDGNAYFNRPGPRLYRSIELLAAAAYPEVSRSTEVAPWEMVPLSATEQHP